MIHVPRMHWPIRAINGLGRAARGLGLCRSSLDPERLIAEAQRSTRLEDYGPGPFREELAILARSLEDEARLNTVGRAIARRSLLDGLEVQLRLQDWFNRHPEIAAQEIREPVIIIGMPRTGTTILHELMALDRNNRVPMTWEAAQPFPPPEADTYDSDPRIAAQDRRLKFSHYLMPGVENMHRMGAALPQECVAITAYAFTSMQFSTIYRLPTYAHWLQHCDLGPSYRFHRRMLQYLQWRYARPHWVLKSPAHLWGLEALLAEYPDARLIQTHRDPLKIVSSLASMIPTLRAAGSDDIDVGEVAREWADSCVFALNASLRSRQSGVIDPSRVVDIQFGEFMSSQAGAVEKAYRALGLDFSPQLAGAIDAYIHANPADKHGGHKHRFDDTGLDVAAERARVREYQDYFGVASEF